MSKSEDKVFENFVQFKTLAETKLEHKINLFESNNGEEFFSKTFNNFWSFKALDGNCSCPI